MTDHRSAAAAGLLVGILVVPLGEESANRVGQGLVFAQTPAVLQPGPEHEQLGYFAGSWRAGGTIASSALGAGGTITSRQTCEWFDGQFALICRAEFDGPPGVPRSALAILGYSTEAQAYTLYSVTDGPVIPTSVALGTVQDDTWTYVGEAQMGGQLIRFRDAFTIVSPTHFTMRQEMSVGDAAWMAVAEWTFTKAP